MKNIQELYISKFFRKDGKIKLKEKLYIPKKYIDEKFLSNFNIVVYPNNCNSRCENFEFRSKDECSCEITEIKLWSKTKKYYKIPYNNNFYMKKLKIIFEKLGIKDLRPSPKMFGKYKIVKRKDFELRKKQKEMIDTMVEAGYGLLEAPVRTGKTVMLLTIAVKLGLKTIILAHQQDLLDQFMDELYDKTNIKEIENITRRKLAGNYGDWQWYNYDFVFCTYQKFITKKGKQRLKEIHNKYGIVGIDETHKSNTSCFSKVVNNFNAKHKYGVSATVKRVDGLEKVNGHVIGPIHITAKDEGLICKKYLYNTKLTLPKSMKRASMFSILRFISYNKERNNYIAKKAIQAANKGRFVVIPVLYKTHQKKLKELVNKYDPNINVDLFYAGCDRKRILAECKTGKIQILIAIRKMITLGINVPKWDFMIQCIPFYNQHNYYQETSRIRTAYDNKPKPILWYIVDDIPYSAKALIKVDKMVHNKLKFIASKSWNGIYQNILKYNKSSYRPYTQSTTIVKRF